MPLNTPHARDFFPNGMYHFTIKSRSWRESGRAWDSVVR
ncbi:hypothetical protein ABID44_001328 [Aquamicrobium ahrensii]|uniref:Transposase n=1 Tax=Aquamicrobium ahrensii TaxID=469551 RepID=A0ABV2KLQ2_9HYPH